VLDEPGVLVVGSEVPNMLEPGAASTLVVSEDVDIGVPVTSHAAVKRRLGEVRALGPSREEPSVWVPLEEGLLEANFVGIDPSLRDAAESYVFEDAELPLLVFGTLGFMRPGSVVEVEGIRIPLPRPSDLLLEKLLTDRSGIKTDRDLLVALGLLLVGSEEQLGELAQTYRELSAESRQAVCSNLALLSLIEPVPGMPDPSAHRARAVGLLRRLEKVR
jgi:hypothetical protein